MLLAADLVPMLCLVDRPRGGACNMAVGRLPSQPAENVRLPSISRYPGAETVLKLVEHADILFEGFRPGVRTSSVSDPNHLAGGGPQLSTDHEPDV